MTEHVELYRKYRPKTFKGVLGQDAAVAALINMVDNNRVPHAILFTGPSGCGKTTLARILATKLDCQGNALHEMNAADTRGIDDIREHIHATMHYNPLGGTTRVWIIDEAAQLTAPAQDSLLKTLEDPPKHCYFMLCTTDPQRLKNTIKTRCHLVELKPVGKPQLQQLLVKTCEKEGITVADPVIAKIIECSEGSARRAMVLLHSVVGLEKEDQLSAITKDNTSDKAIQLAWHLLNRKSWAEVASLLSELPDSEENLRRMLLSVYSGMMLKNNKATPRLATLLNIFRYPNYDSGKPGFVLDCYLALGAK